MMNIFAAWILCILFCIWTTPVQMLANADNIQEDSSDNTKRDKNFSSMNSKIAAKDPSTVDHDYVRHSSGDRSHGSMSYHQERLNHIHDQTYVHRDPLMKEYIDTRVQLTVMTSHESFYSEIKRQMEQARTQTENKYIFLENKTDDRFDELEQGLQRHLELIENELKDLADLKAALRIFASIIGIIGVSTLPQLFRIIHSFYMYIISSKETGL